MEWIDTKAPFHTAKLFIRGRDRVLVFWHGNFLEHDGTCYRQITLDDLKASLYPWMSKAQDSDGMPCKPTKPKVENAVDALKALVNLPSAHEPPCFIGEVDLPGPGELIACQNGLLHLSTGRLYPHTSHFFNLNALTFGFDPDAPVPLAWLRFLKQVWPDDPEAVSTLQEVFGYLLTTDTSQQKIFLIVGPMRSGKGTLARVLTQLVGQANATGPTLASLAQPFGLAPLIGKQVAIIADARLGGKSDQSAIAERLLSISGEDALSIPRKFQVDYTARLPVRFVILTNELPRLADASGALASRFIVLTMKNSFLGKEDPGLTSRLLRELPAILNWAICGWKRLATRGYFIQPKSSAEAIQEMADLSSPVSAFVRDCCEVSPAAQVECGQLYQKWRDWCEGQGREHPGNLQTFGRDIRAALPGVRVIQPRQDGGRVRVYSGIGLKDWHAVERETPHCNTREKEKDIYNASPRVPLRATEEEVLDHLWRS